MKQCYAIGWGLGLSWSAAAPAVAAEAGAAALSTQALLVTAALLCASLLVVAIFSLWQSHRMYLDTVQLHQTLTAAQQAFLTHALRAAQAPRPQATRSSAGAQSPQTIKSPAPPAAPAATDDQNGNGRSGVLAGLDDVELAVLEKLASDPAFFTRHSLDGFGASQLTVDNLLRRGLAKLDGLGRPAVPESVQVALKTWLPQG